MWRIVRRIFFLLLVSAVVSGVAYELLTSRLQAHFFNRLATRSTIRVMPGGSNDIRFPQAGPYDNRLGYAELPDFIRRLEAEGYGIEAQARLSPFMLEYADRGFYPVYREKNQAGLHILDRLGRPVFSAAYPERVYPAFDDIPDIVVKTLLFIENRELLGTDHPFKNPAVEWRRLVGAVLDLGASVVHPGRKVPGGSTLATQIEKFRHSPGGQTGSLKEKFRQMVSASVRAYLEGEETLQARCRIILAFVNSMPLGAIHGYGEVSGFGDGLFAWYGADFVETTRILANRPAGSDAPTLDTWAMALKEVVSLFVAQRRPSYFMLEDRPALEAKTDSYLRILAEAGVITPWERDAALSKKLELQSSLIPEEGASFLARKAVNAVRTNLLSLLGIQQLYQLNHLDLSVGSTIDQLVQQEVTTLLKKLNDPEFVKEAGLNGSHLLGNSDPSKVIYSLSLYEKADGANLLRLQTDTFNQPLNINSGIKLELGSSAKLRTLITYLEIVAALHERYRSMSLSELGKVEVAAADKINRWALDYLSSRGDNGLTAMLSAAMQREYSADPNERFFTGGGLHAFSNFDATYDTGTFSVQEAFNNSINLVFIRLMRDVVQYYKFQIPGVMALLSDVNDPRRHEYLVKFADQEGVLFIQRFYRKYTGKPFDDAFLSFIQEVRANPKHLAAVFRYVKPAADLQEFKGFLSDHIRNSSLSDDTVAALYNAYGPDNYSLIDRGYISGIHPLELWMMAYLYQHPNATRTDIIQASVGERQTVYTWLFKTSSKNKQDTRIRTLLEVEAFSEIHAEWKRLKYPFNTLVPSYATAIGSSADRPAALSEIVGIILRNGKWTPSIRVDQLRFGEATPYETRLKYLGNSGEQVMQPEVAGVVREALLGVVTSGTAKRVHQAFQLADGTSLAVGGKTGTGDNRYDVYGQGGRVIQSRVINRTAVFVFFLGDRFYGTITAYVAGPEAAGYTFTSSLPTQVLKVIAPKLSPLLEADDGGIAKE